MTFSHRNGETEPPILTNRYFWYIDGEDEFCDDGIFGMLYLCDGFAHGAIGALEDYAPIENLYGRWWGPVVPPWDADLAMPQDKVAWSKKFRNDLLQWQPCLSGRLLNAILRAANSFKMLERLDDSDYFKEQWYADSLNAVIAFGEKGHLLDFNQWLPIVRDEPDRLMYIRDVGRKGEKQLLDAIDKYLALSADHAA